MNLPLIGRIKDPVSGLTHLAGAFLGFVGLIFLVAKGLKLGNYWHVSSFSVFGLSLILLYSSSAFYHLLDVSPEARVIFRRIDHTMIFVLIAGSYTPFCLIPLRGPWGWSILITVWSLAILGLLLSIFWIDAPRKLTTALYLVMGWLMVFAIFPLSKAVSFSVLYWLAGGGIFYSIGAIIYALKKPNPYPPHFGFHEIWHLFVLAGSLCHFLSISALLD